MAESPEDELEGLARHPDLGGFAATLRVEWRDEEEELARAALEQWTHQRTLGDVARELMHRGDNVAVLSNGTAFSGRIIEVGRDVVVVATVLGKVDIHLEAPVMLRVVERAKSGGTRGGGVNSFRARMAEREMDGDEVIVGTVLTRHTLRGAIMLGRDHLHVRDRFGAETYVRLADITYVAGASD